jgi:AraC-like DNA-binding protein
MFIDFPEAELEKPTQCTALVIDNAYLNQNLQRINESLHKDQTLVSEWKVDLAELILRNNAQMAQLTSKLLFAFNQKEPLLDFQVDILLRELILSMLREQNLTVLRREKGYSKDNPFEEVFRFIRQHLQDKILIDDLCKVACMSKSTFYRTFVETYAISPVQLINEERIKFAKELLIQPEVSVKEAGYAAGFNDPNYFCRLFKKIEGMAPGSYRKIHGFT